jgi:hypothetical protein
MKAQDYLDDLLEIQEMHENLGDTVAMKQII